MQIRHMPILRCPANDLMLSLGLTPLFYKGRGQFVPGLCIVIFKTRHKLKKTNHSPDYAKNRTADVIPKGSGSAVPMQHWEVNRDLTPEGSDTAAGAFLPRCGYKRPTTHTKTNECDH